MDICELQGRRLRGDTLTVFQFFKGHQKEGGQLPPLFPSKTGQEPVVRNCREGCIKLHNRKKVLAKLWKKLVLSSSSGVYKKCFTRNAVRKTGMLSEQTPLTDLLGLPGSIFDIQSHPKVPLSSLPTGAGGKGWVGFPVPG